MQTLVNLSCSLKRVVTLSTYHSPRHNEEGVSVELPPSDLSVAVPLGAFLLTDVGGAWTIVGSIIPQVGGPGLYKEGH